MNGKGLDEFFQKALAKDRDQRFATAAEMIAALEACSMDVVETPRRVVARDAVTLEIPAERSTPGAARADGGAGTNAAISAEIGRVSSAASRTDPRGWASRIGWRTAALGGALIAVMAWFAGWFDRGQLSDVKPSEVHGEPATTVATAPQQAQVALAPTATSEPTTATTSSAPPFTSASASASSSAAPSSTVVSSTAVMAKVRPPPVASVKAAASTSAKSTATTDPIFGIDKKK